MKKYSDVLGWQTGCLNYHKCPVCYGCRNYNSASLKCMKCAKNRRLNICNTQKHTSDKISTLLHFNEIIA